MKPTDHQLKELVKWHRMDGTKKGELTRLALTELLSLRRDIDDAQKALNEYHEKGGKTIEEMKRELEL